MKKLVYNCRECRREALPESDYCRKHKEAAEKRIFQKAIEKKLRREPFHTPLWVMYSMFYISGLLAGYLLGKWS